MSRRNTILWDGVSAVPDEARWHHAKRAANLRLQIRVTIKDIDELLSKGSVTFNDLALIRRRLETALTSDREGG